MLFFSTGSQDRLFNADTSEIMICQRSTMEQNSQWVLDWKKGSSQLWIWYTTVGYDRIVFGHLSKCYQSPPLPRGRNLAAEVSISISSSTIGLSQPAMKNLEKTELPWFLMLLWCTMTWLTQPLFSSVLDQHLSLPPLSGADKVAWLDHYANGNSWRTNWDCPPPSVNRERERQQTLSCAQRQTVPVDRH